MSFAGSYKTDSDVFRMLSVSHILFNPGISRTSVTEVSCAAICDDSSVASEVVAGLQENKRKKVKKTIICFIRLLNFY